MPSRTSPSDDPDPADAGHARPAGAAALAARLGLTDDELCTVLATDALSIVSGEADSSPQLAILNALLDDAQRTISTAALERWLRTRGPAGSVPVDLLLARDFAAFESALAELAERGFVIRGRGAP